MGLPMLFFVFLGFQCVVLKKFRKIVPTPTIKNLDFAKILYNFFGYYKFIRVKIASYISDVMTHITISTMNVRN